MDSGIVFLDNISEDAHTASEAHRQWGTGFLFNNHTEIGSSGSSQWDRRIHIGNRGDYGTSHGWACANCVVWNARMNGSSVVVEKPPTAQNYAIGTIGFALDRGPFMSNTGSWIEGTNRPGLDPRSLYLRQLQDRLQPVSRDPLPQQKGLHLYPAAPNPTNGRALLRFNLDAAGHVRLSVYDVMGRVVRQVVDRGFAPGEHDLSLDLGDLPSGLNLYRMIVQTGSGVQSDSGRVTLAR